MLILYLTITSHIMIEGRNCQSKINFCFRISFHQDCIMDNLHQSHPRNISMKSITSYFGDLNWVRTLRRVQSHAFIVKSVPLNPWVWCRCTQPWKRIHVDYAEPFLNINFLVVVDAYSKWLEVIEMFNTMAKMTICELRKLFARYSL